MAPTQFAEILIRIGMEPDLEPGVVARRDDEDSSAILVGDAATSAPYRSVVEAYASGMRAAKSLVIGRQSLGPDLH
jgi:thioredoxin reductase (NADPH)